MSTPTVTPARINGIDITVADVTEVHSPFDGSVVGAVPTLGAEHIDQAVAVALERHRSGALPAHERASILDRAAALLTERHETFAQSISAESAKPIGTARVEAQRAVDTIRFAAAVARTATGETIPMEASSAGMGKIGFVTRVPIGVVAAVSPFNFPLNLVCHKLAPAIAAGCPVVLKPASATPLTAIALVALFEEAGLPAGWINVVTVPGKVADHLVTHDDVAMVTFTGSPDVGWGIRARAPRKRVSLELGNNAPVIIEPDADIEAVAKKISAAGYSFAGQSCISVQRVYVHRDIHDEFVEALTGFVSGLNVGDPSDASTDVSALINRGETQRVSEWISEATTAGATLTCGGTIGDDGVLTPSVLDGITPDMAVSHTEVFGPVVGVAAYDDYETALKLANDSRYGLQAGVFTSSMAKGLRAAQVLDYGGVLVNEVPTFRADQMPYGGLRDSGNTREGPAYTIDEMTERRLVIFQG